MRPTETKAVTHYYKKHLYRGRKMPDHYKCPYCPKKYKDIRNLQAHVQVTENSKETGNRTGKCDFIHNGDDIATRWRKTAEEIEKTIENEQERIFQMQQNLQAISND